MYNEHVLSVPCDQCGATGYIGREICFACNGSTRLLVPDDKTAARDLRIATLINNALVLAVIIGFAVALGVAILKLIHWLGW